MGASVKSAASAVLNRDHRRKRTRPILGTKTGTFGSVGLLAAWSKTDSTEARDRGGYKSNAPPDAVRLRRGGSSAREAGIYSRTALVFEEPIWFTQLDPKLTLVLCGCVR